jgi:hypothetical protein
MIYATQDKPKYSPPAAVTADAAAAAARTVDTRTADTLADFTVASVHVGIIQSQTSFTSLQSQAKKHGDNRFI